jgi:hypothetical protein
VLSPLSAVFVTSFTISTLKNDGCDLNTTVTTKDHLEMHFQVPRERKQMTQLALGCQACKSWLGSCASLSSADSIQASAAAPPVSQAAPTWPAELFAGFNLQPMSLHSRRPGSSQQHGMLAVTDLFQLASVRG